MDNQVIGYKDLAAIPKDKAILEVERPDLMVYEPHFNISALDRLSKSREVRMSEISSLSLYHFVFDCSIMMHKKGLSHILQHLLLCEINTVCVF